MKNTQLLSITDRNTELPYFPSLSWQLTEADKGVITLPTFNWIQAIFDPALLSEPPTLAIWSGQYADDGSPILSLVRFAYSGERINFKGNAIFATGTDYRGDTVTSLVIGTDATTDFAQIIAYGGMY